MSQNLHIVFSQPPAGVTSEEFNDWYDAHLAEILATPGFLSARRFRLEPVVEDETAQLPFGYLALYEVEGDPDKALAAMAELGLGSKDSYAALKEVDTGELELPDWFKDVRFASWNCMALGERVEADSEARE
jgi:hypothetical protein